MPTSIIADIRDYYFVIKDNYFFAFETVCSTFPFLSII